MLNFNNILEKEVDKLIDLCDSPIEIELLLKIIDYTLTDSIFYNSDEESKCFKLTILRDLNQPRGHIGEEEITTEYKYPDIEPMEFKYFGIRIDYSGHYEKEFSRYIEIKPQHKFYYEDIGNYPNTTNRYFLLDFGVFLKDYKTDKLIKKFCIECDGYKYHSEQEKRIQDNQRTLKLLSEGDYHTLRFLGREINDMNSSGIELLLDILMNEKNIDYEIHKDKRLKSSVDENGFRWYKPKDKK